MSVRVDRLERLVFAFVLDDTSTNPRSPKIKARARFSIGAASRDPISALASVVPKPHGALQRADVAGYFCAQWESWARLAAGIRIAPSKAKEPVSKDRLPPTLTRPEAGPPKRPCATAVVPKLPEVVLCQSCHTDTGTQIYDVISVPVTRASNRRHLVVQSIGIAAVGKGCPAAIGYTGRCIVGNVVIACVVDRGREGGIGRDDRLLGCGDRRVGSPRSYAGVQDIASPASQEASDRGDTLDFICSGVDGDIDTRLVDAAREVHCVDTCTRGSGCRRSRRR